VNHLEHLLAGDTHTAAAAAADPAMQRIRTLLASRSEAAGLLDVAYRTLDTPVGRLLLAATPEGLVKVAYQSQDHDAVLADLAARVSPRVLHAPGRLDAAARQLDEYFTAHRQGFDLPVDLQLAHGFRRTVLQHLAQVPYGDTVSYAHLAASTGNAKAVRATGTACATNPLPLVIPCHRVVRSDGTPGAYVGGAATKQTLLQLEHAARPPARH
jgi:methylated-DNA-[protein]-cysteine S-methyltransferase